MKSLRIRVLFSSLTMFFVLGILFSVGLNTYVERQYYNRKIDKMIQTGNQIQTQLLLTLSGTSVKESLDYLGYQFEGRITLLDVTEDIILYKNQRYVYNYGKLVREIRYGEHTALVINTNYPVANSLWLGYLAKVDDTKFAWLEIPIVTIDETLEVFRSYLWKSMIFGFFLSVAVSFWLAKSITDPIAELNCLAQKIGRLEFDSHYSHKRRDEIGQLGMTLNNITDILRETISSLQTELAKKQQLEKMRKRFVAQVSHEMQTPISVISSYTEALMDGMADEAEIPEYYGILLDECQKMSKMVKDLLDLSSLESGLSEYKREPIVLSDFIQNLVRKQEWILKAENKVVESDVEPIRIVADRFRMEQALGNILSNSIKHAEQKIWLRLYGQQQEAILLVANDGSRIEEVDLPYVWDSFYKGKSKRSGTGLGLAIASEILKHHQVKYRVFHDERGYVCYELRFPL